jgi:hypothetical protein
MMLSNYQPSAEQLARDEALKRFNRLYLILPIVIAVLIALALIITLAILAFLPDHVETRQFISGLADLVMILAALPATLLCAILPVAYVAIALNRRQQRQLYPQTGPMANRGRIQSFLWWLQGKLDQLQAAAESGSTALADRLMKAHERFEYYSTIGERLRRNFRR